MFLFIWHLHFVPIQLISTFHVSWCAGVLAATREDLSDRGPFLQSQSENCKVIQRMKLSATEEKEILYLCLSLSEMETVQYENR